MVHQELNALKKEFKWTLWTVPLDFRFFNQTRMCHYQQWIKLFLISVLKNLPKCSPAVSRTPGCQASRCLRHRMSLRHRGVNGQHFSVKSFPVSKTPGSQRSKIFCKKLPGVLDTGQSTDKNFLYKASRCPRPRGVNGQKFSVKSFPVSQTPGSQRTNIFCKKLPGVLDTGESHLQTTVCMTLGNQQSFLKINANLLRDCVTKSNAYFNSTYKICKVY